MATPPRRLPLTAKPPLTTTDPKDSGPRKARPPRRHGQGKHTPHPKSLPLSDLQSSATPNPTRAKNRGEGIDPEPYIDTLITEGHGEVAAAGAAGAAALAAIQTAMPAWWSVSASATESTHTRC